MKTSILFMACLCASVVLFSQQSFASLANTDLGSTFYQTGTWANEYTNSPPFIITSANWQLSTPGSWKVEGQYVPISQGVQYWLYSIESGLLTFNFSDNQQYHSPITGSFTILFNFGAPDNWQTGLLGCTFSGRIYNNNNQYTGYSIEFNPSGEIAYNGIPNFPSTFNSLFIGGNIVDLPGSITGSPVPIPAAVWLFGSGLLGLIGIRKRIKN